MKVGKAYIADSDKIQITGSSRDDRRRGLAVYTATELFNVQGKGKDGQQVQAKYEQSCFYLTIDERIRISKLCSPVAGIVNSRMSRISGLNWRVVPDSEKMDETHEKMKQYKQVYDEFAVSLELKHQVVKSQIFRELNREMGDLLPDLSNFNTALLRWKKRTEKISQQQAKDVELWLEKPNLNEDWNAWVRKYVYDLMIHGAVATYKEAQFGKLENFYLLPGGSVFPLRGEYVNSIDAYAQIVYGKEPLIYFSDEVSFQNYLPTSVSSWGNIPLEALINKITESLLFDKLMADQADGTQLPKKMVVVGDNNPFGNLREDFVPIDADEQHALDTKLNEPKKGGVVTFTGNTATVVDLSRENTMQIQMQRQKDIREEVGLVFMGSNMEMNLTGSSNTSGRETSESQAEISEGRGIVPITVIIANELNRNIIPYRFGNGFTFEFDTGKSETEDIDLILKKVQTGLYAPNELRVEELGKDPVPGEEFDKPSGPPQQDQGMEPDGF